VKDVDASVRFYENAPRPSATFSVPRRLRRGVRSPRRACSLALLPGQGPAGPGTHVAFAQPIRVAVDRFYEGGLAGAVATTAAPACASTTARRTTRRPLRPDGNNVEAVCTR